MHYNRKVLEFYETHRDQCILFNINDFNERCEEGRSILADWLGTDLSLPYSTVYRASEIASTPSASARRINAVFRLTFGTQLSDVYSQLEDRTAL